MSYWDRNYAQYLYQYLLSDIGNDIGVSALLGNIYAESGICPFRCEGDNTYPYTASYNATIDTIRGLSSYDFQRYHLPTSSSSQVGYSLAQWTTYARKDNYYNHCGQSLLGDEVKSAEFLLKELKDTTLSPNYINVYNRLVNATDLRAASDYVLINYEAPLDQSEAVKRLRFSYSSEVYNDFSGLPPIPTRQLPAWLLAHNHMKNRTFN